MKLKIVKEILNAEVIMGDNLEQEVKMGCGCDLMSDVLSFVKSNTLLLTGLTNLQVIYTAEMADVQVICFVRGKRPTREIVELAKNKNITLLATDIPMFESCGRLHRAGLKGCSEE